MSIHIEFRGRRGKNGGMIGLSSSDERFLGTSGDIVLTGEGILPKHARLFSTANGLQIEPMSDAAVSINGKDITAPAPVNDGDWLALGPIMFQVRLGKKHEEKKHAQPVQPHAGNQVILQIGRLPECELSIPSPLVSRNHAKMHFQNGKLVLQDLNSTNGTFVNEKRIFTPTVLNPGDKVEIAAFAFTFTGEALQPIDDSGLVHLEARGLTKEVRDRSTGQPRRLLDDIDLVIEPGEFVVIFGTSGSGKSTLLDALNGRRPATSGQVLFNGTDFYSAFDVFRSAIGYVPQQDIVHRKICLQNALQYTARLRLPSDTSGEEIKSHIARVLNQVGLSDKALSPIDTPAPLSGGQLKRVSLAVELIANPNVLFLDEVTSGLDAGTDKKMMQLFSELASENKTIVCVTHSLENVDVCDLVLLLHRGRIVFFGAPREAVEHFGVSRLSDVYELIDSRPVEFWSQKYAESRYHEAYIRKRKSDARGQEREQRKAGTKRSKPEESRFKWSQLTTLTRRYIDLLLSDRRNLGILLLQAPLIATLIGLVFDTSGPLDVRVRAESNIALMLVLSAIWCGCLNSTREVVKELPIYLRERAINLSLGPYLVSKLIPLAVLCLVQCLAMLSIVTLLAPWSGDFTARLITLFAAGMAATTMGLAISTLVDTNDKASALIPIMLIPQVILANVIVKLGAVAKIIAQSTMISFSAFDAMVGTFSKDMSPLMPAERAFPVDLGITAALCIVFFIAALFGLKIKDRKN
ncbi:MAG: ATP-binding cassette domain-containing protein [Desulfobacteraceae bacterium]|nr:ATP-binding cassette domain-containing protein [Desulfobacteraceae bacterium]